MLLGDRHWWQMSRSSTRNDNYSKCHWYLTTDALRGREVLLLGAPGALLSLHPKGPLTQLPPSDRHGSATFHRRTESGRSHAWSQETSPLHTPVRVNNSPKRSQLTKWAPGRAALKDCQPGHNGVCIMHISDTETARTLRSTQWFLQEKCP